MVKDQVIGGLILLGSIVAAVVYAWGIVYHTILVLQLTACAAVFTLLAILGWMGYTLVRAPRPELLEEIEATAKEAKEGVEK